MLVPAAGGASVSGTNLGESAVPVVVIASPKGGVGKSTLATNVAGYWARAGRPVLLGDVDPQQSAQLWLERRPEHLPRIESWSVRPHYIVRPADETRPAVLDTPAGLDSGRLRSAVRVADAVLVPLQPGVFDMAATAAFLDTLQEMQDYRSFRIGLVGTRVDSRTQAAEQLQEFLRALEPPVVATLRQTQNYVQMAARGLSLFDGAPSRVGKDLAQWQDLGRWLDAIAD